jgi:hypothetical protein
MTDKTETQLDEIIRLLKIVIAELTTIETRQM